MINKNDFINSDSEFFKKILDIMKETGIMKDHYSFGYNIPIQEEEYDYSDFYVYACDICNRLLFHYDFDDVIDTVNEIFEYWTGKGNNFTKEYSDDIKNFVNKILDYFIILNKEEYEEDQDDDYDYFDDDPD